MFKVSLLPASYRRHLQSRNTIDMVSKVALIILVCLFVVYGGVAIKSQILSSKLRNLESQNRLLEQQFPALQEYQSIYNDLQAVEKMVKSVTPEDSEAVDFFIKISNIQKTNQYVQFKTIDLEDWFTAGVCTIECTTQDYQSMKDFSAKFQSEDMKKAVAQVETTDVIVTDSDEGTTVDFKIVLTRSNAVEIPTNKPVYAAVTNEKGETQTNTDGEVQTTDIANTTAAAGSTTAGTETTTAKG